MNNTIASEEIKEKILELRKRNYGYKKIASELGLKRDYVRGICVKNGLGGFRAIPEPVYAKDTEWLKPKPKEKKVHLYFKMCPICRREFVSKTRKRVFCSQSCWERNRRAKSEIRSCAECGERFVSLKGREKYCSVKCREEHARKQDVVRQAVCMGCGKTYIKRNGTKGYCSNKCYNETKRKSHSEFVQELFKIHEGYIVPLEEYKGSDRILKCKCLKCGNEIERIARKYVGSYKHGCPYCKNRSHGEETISEWLDEHGYEYVRQYTDEGLKYFNNLFYDFAIIENGRPIMFIEYDGEQHFKPVDALGGEEKFMENIIRDEIKNNYAAEVGVPLLRISYKQKKNISSILERNLPRPTVS